MPKTLAQSMVVQNSNKILADIEIFSSTVKLNKRYSHFNIAPEILTLNNSSILCTDSKPLLFKIFRRFFVALRPTGGPAVEN